MAKHGKTWQNMAKQGKQVFAKKLVYDILTFATWVNGGFYLPLGTTKNSYKPKNEDEYENFYKLVAILENGSKGVTKKMKKLKIKFLIN